MSKIIAIQNIAREGVGLFKQVAEIKDMKLHIIKAYTGEKLLKPDKNDLILIMGGPMGLKDINNPNYYWLKDELNLIKYATKKEIALIGVCLGAQLIAYALGGGIQRLKQGIPPQYKPELGWEKITFTNSEYSNLRRNKFSKYLHVLHWHEDRVVLPAKSLLIASSDACKEQIFLINKKTIGIQCHLEITSEVISRWIEEDQAFITSAKGPHGVELIKKQQKIYGMISEKARINELEDLFDFVYASSPRIDEENSKYQNRM